LLSPCNLRYKGYNIVDFAHRSEVDYCLFLLLYNAKRDKRKAVSISINNTTIIDIDKDI